MYILYTHKSWSNFDLRPFPVYNAAECEFKVLITDSASPSERDKTRQISLFYLV